MHWKPSFRCIEHLKLNVEGIHLCLVIYATALKQEHICHILWEDSLLLNYSGKLICVVDSHTLYLCDGSACPQLLQNCEPFLSVIWSRF